MTTDQTAGILILAASLIVLAVSIIRHVLRAEDAAESKALTILTESPEAKSTRLSLVPPLNHDAETLALVIGLDFLDRVPTQRVPGRDS